MQLVHDDLLAVLRARRRDLVVLYELYEPGYDISLGFNPHDAVDRFAGQTYSYSYLAQTVSYRREIKANGDAGVSLSVNKTITKQLNSITVKVSNVSRYMSAFVLEHKVQGMILVIRGVSRSISDPLGGSPNPKSMILFVGPCGRPDGFDRGEGTITARPFLGNIEAQVPPRDFQTTCPLTFKGTECLGTETLSQKSTTYKNAAVCNKTEAQCIEYENEEFFQGVKLYQIQSSFVHKANESFWKKVLNILPGISRRKTTVGNSIFNATPLGEAIPLILGRVFKQLIPLQFRDTGETIWFKMAAGRGPIADFVNTRSNNLNFSQPLEITEHLGEYGGEGTQTADAAFPGGDFLSRLAYMTGRVIGSDVEVEDPAPEISSVVAGITVQMYSDVQPSGTGKLLTGVGGVTAPGSATSSPGTQAATYDDQIASLTPEAYYKCHEASGPTLSDSSGNGVDGLAHASAIFEIAGPIERDSPTYGIENKVATISAPLLQNPTDFSVEGWGIGGDLKTLVCRGGIPGQNGSFYICFRNPGRVEAMVSFEHGADNSYTLTAFGTFTGDWNHVVLTREGNVLTLYLNGCPGDRRDDLPVDPITYDRYNDEPWLIGFSGNILAFGEFFPGDGTSHVAFYDYALTAEDVANNNASALNDPHGCPGTDWTDNPVDHARYLLTEPAVLNLPEGYIDDQLSAYAAAYNTGAIKDETNAERCLISQDEIDNAGTLFKRYNSTGLFGPRSFESTRAQVPAGVFDREAEYETFDPEDPPTSLDVITQYRKRYTGNLELRTKSKALDTLYDVIFPTFRGFLKWNVRGQAVIDSERPADHTFLLAAAVPTDTTIQVKDVLPWKNVLGSPYLLEGKVRIGVPYRFADDPGRSEVRGVTLAQYSSAGNSISLASVGSGGPTATASGANLTGGSSSVQASGTVTITGTLSADATITVTIDGIDCQLTLVSGESSSTIGLRVAAVINADPILREYVEAHAEDNVVTIYAKVGVLTLSSALAENHYTEIANPTTAPTVASSAGALGAGVYLVAYAYRNPNGSTVISELASITLTASKKIDVTGLGTLPAGVTSVDWYVSRSANSKDLGFILNNDGSGHSINSLPSSTAVSAPTINTTGEEVLRGMMSFAGKSLTYADTARANILDGTFTWPEDGNRSEINQLKGKHVEAIQDFAEQPLTVNDTPHQEDLKKINTQDVDLTAVDNYNQAARLLNGFINTLRGGDFFFKWGSVGEALLLEEGDVVFVSDDSGPFRNVPVRLKTLQINRFPDITLGGRFYATLHYGDLVATLSEGEGGSGSQAGLFVPSTLPTFDSPPDIEFNEGDFPPNGLVQTTDTPGITSIRGGAIFGASSFGQFAKVRLIKRAGVTVDEIINPNLRPNSDLEGTFEFIASAEGLYTVELEVCNNRGQCNATKPTASITVTFGALGVMLVQSGGILLTQDGNYLAHTD